MQKFLAVSSLAIIIHLPMMSQSSIDGNVDAVPFSDSLIPSLRDYVITGDSKIKSLHSSLNTFTTTPRVDFLGSSSSYTQPKDRCTKGRTNRSKHLGSPYRVRRVKTGVSDEELGYVYRVYSKYRPNVSMNLPLWIGQSVRHSNSSKKNKSTEVRELPAGCWHEILQEVVAFYSELSILSFKDREYVFQLFQHCAIVASSGDENNDQTTPASSFQVENNSQRDLFPWLAAIST
jgi:hypothetical protein